MSDATQTLPFVSQYKIVGGIYYAFDNTVCNSGATPIIIAAGPNYACNNFVNNYNNVLQATCDFYTRPKLSDTSLSCDDCGAHPNGAAPNAIDPPVPTFCKLIGGDGCGNT